MKKAKIFTQIVAISAFTTPIINLVACSKTLSQKIIKDSINEFFQICKYPRPSYHLDKITTYLVDKIKKLGYIPNKDNSNNIWFDVPANDSSYASYPKLILQGHTDMVFAGPKELEFKPIIPQYHKKGNYLTSKNNKTSLGADNGIGIGLILALIQNKEVKHGPLRVLLTANEEPGMLGANDLDPSVLDTDYLISLDGEIENGGLYVSCAGGSVYKASHQFNQVSAANKIYKIEASNFKGGHSGNDIGKLRGNAEKFIFEGLNELIENKGDTIQLASFNHGNTQVANNALVPYAICTFSSTLNEAEIKSVFNNKLVQYKQYYVDDQDITFNLTSGDATNCINLDDSKKIINSFGKTMLYGVYDENDVLVTSPVENPIHSANIGPTEIKNGLVYFEKYERTSKKDFVSKIETNITSALRNIGFIDSEIKLESEVLPWEKNPDDKIIKLCKKGYEANDIKWYERKTNGGVEPAKFILKRPTIQQTCLGAKFVGVHSINETCYLDVLESSLKCLLYVIEHINEVQ